MKPVDQISPDLPEANCFSACVASILDIPAQSVPDFGEEDTWFETFSSWLKPYGLFPVTFAYTAKGWKPPTEALCILGGYSSRGSHACVGRGSEVIHDPHPSREGLIVIDDVTLLIPFEPEASVAQQ